ncbi:hypothetical protein D3C78_1058420 [compost metagenome]
MHIVSHSEYAFKEHIRRSAAIQIDIKKLITLIAGDDFDVDLRVIFFVLLRKFISCVFQEAVVIGTLLGSVEYAFPLRRQPYLYFYLLFICIGGACIRARI